MNANPILLQKKYARIIALNGVNLRNLMVGIFFCDILTTIFYGSFLQKEYTKTLSFY